MERAPYTRLAISETAPYWIVSFVRSGELVTITEGVDRPVSSGSVMVHPPGIHFEEHASGPGVHEWFAFDCWLGSHLDLLVEHPVPFVIPIPDPADYSRRFDEFLAAANQGRLAAMIKGLDLLQLVLSAVPAEVAPMADPQLEAKRRFGEVIRFMRSHLADPLDRQQIAAEAGMHPVSLDRCFREAFGETPTQMLRAMRISYALRLLASTDSTLDQIAVVCGFGEATHFSRVFRSARGMTPGDFRRSLKSSRNGYLDALNQDRDARKV